MVRCKKMFYGGNRNEKSSNYIYQSRYGWNITNVCVHCLQTLLWKNRLEISKYIIRDRVNKENVDEFIKEFEDYNKKTEIFNYDELGQDSKTIYDMLNEIRGE